MRTKGLYNIVVLALLTALALLPGCRSGDSISNGESAARQEVPAGPLTVNLSHLEHLFDSLPLPGGEMGGAVWIYCEAPDYHLLDDDDEGYTCVDDMARALVVYAMHHELYGDALSQKRVNQLARTILHLQSDNGYFYNFLWPDNSINTTFKTSVATPNWWSWRALWALEVALSQELLEAEVSASAKTSTARLVEVVKRDFPADMPRRDTSIQGVLLPNDLLEDGGGYDQTAVLLIGLSAHVERTGDEEAQQVGQRFAERLLATQTSDTTFPSWYEHWHAWGNSQAYALLASAGTFPTATTERQAGTEVTKLLPRYLGARTSSALCAADSSASSTNPLRVAMQCNSKPERFPQIAYGQRPFVWSAMAAYQASGDSTYLQLAKQTASWFSGNNLTGIPMYDPTTGRGYDGIIDDNTINYNSGAESTIESLLSLLTLEMEARVIGLSG